MPPLLVGRVGPRRPPPGSGAELATALGGRRDRVEERGAHGVRLERPQAGGGGAAGRRDRSAQRLRTLGRFVEEAGRAEQRLGGERWRRRCGAGRRGPRPRSSPRRRGTHRPARSPTGRSRRRAATPRRARPCRPRRGCARPRPGRPRRPRCPRRRRRPPRPRGRGCWAWPARRRCPGRAWPPAARRSPPRRSTAPAPRRPCRPTPGTPPRRRPASRPARVRPPGPPCRRSPRRGTGRPSSAARPANRSTTRSSSAGAHPPGHQAGEQRLAHLAAADHLEPGHHHVATLERVRGGWSAGSARSPTTSPIVVRAEPRNQRSR